MYKTLRRIHLWLSVPFGIVVAIICLTGFILLFEPAHGHGAERPEFFLNVMRLHRWLFDAPPVKGMMTPGKLIVGITTIDMILVVISGIAMWWMRARHGVKRNLRIVVSKGWNQFCTSLHVAGGAWVAVILLVLAFTGLTWSFGWYREGFNALFGIAKGSKVVYGIHTGAFLGILSKVLWGIAALIGFSLPLTGYWMWIRRITSRRGKQVYRQGL